MLKRFRVRFRESSSMRGPSVRLRVRALSSGDIEGRELFWVLFDKVLKSVKFNAPTRRVVQILVRKLRILVSLIQ